MSLPGPLDIPDDHQRASLPTSLINDHSSASFAMEINPRTMKRRAMVGLFLLAVLVINCSKKSDVRCFFFMR